ncbi:MAG TPA: tRNA (guanosine(46)-N7)-methyltransferase TrmB [Bacteroidales bacterium]|nr:tRNA (guanosine(46)-N7)-methyltransferase TrmB [Bacteroidales bacterium]HPT20430.1 tRNA (guanosine(46)-N7)-methyltransferase TrmB [Bacteroidales bacterium]
MGKNKLARWSELGSYDNVIQPKIGDITSQDHPIKGRWNKDMFKNENPVVLELGCGKGEYTVGLATRFPGKNYIGVDIKGARMWRGAKTSNDNKLSNVAFLRTRIEFINRFFAPDEVDEIWVTFPDPQPGGRNADKRLVSPRFLNNYRLFLKNKGTIHLKTDNTGLFKYAQKVVNDNKLDTIIATDNLYSEDLPDDILSIRTHYESIFLSEGLQIKYIAFRLEKDKIIDDVLLKARKG